MWQNNEKKKPEQQDAEVVDFDEFVLVVSPCTVTLFFCLENASKNFL